MRLREDTTKHISLDVQEFTLTNGSKMVELRGHFDDQETGNTVYWSLTVPQGEFDARIAEYVHGTDEEADG